MKKIILFLTSMTCVSVFAETTIADAPEIPAIPGSEIYLFSIDDQNGVPALESGKNITNSIGYDSQPKFDKHGKFVYYTKIRSGQADIYYYDIKKGVNVAYLETPESEYSPTTIPGESGLSVIQVDNKGDQYLVKLKKGKAERYSNLKQVGYHNWTQNKGLHLWSFILNDQNGGDLYHQNHKKKTTKLDENIGRSFITDKNRRTLYFVDKASTPWQIKSRTNKNLDSAIVMELPAGSEDFTLDSKGRFWAGQGRNLFVSTNRKHWTLVKQFTEANMGEISRLTTGPKSKQIAIVFQEVLEEKTTEQESTE